MARRRSTDGRGRLLSPAELEVLERLVERGSLIAIPAQANAKPRKIAAVSLAEGGRRVLFYLAKETTEI
ncbi:MAG TPA: hypothetical protein VFA23_02280 [Dongiaceae bacterium]|nr:hypothetical protein [Dongiaceae bacterium]